jgi:2-methylcitrate dehydratase PrpD
VSNETRTLAAFTAGLRYEEIPSDVLAVAKACLIDLVGTSLFGSRLAWCGSIKEYARQVGGHGRSAMLSDDFAHLSAPAAALANGTFAHAFEFDTLRQPSVGVHPGSTALVGALAIAQEQNAPGRDLLAAFVGACEGMFRIGLAAKSTSEKMGFHAPGITGVFGSVLAAARLLNLDVEKTVRALGIGGSLGSGVLAFAKAGNGGMVKRLHMGRAAEGGILAAGLAQRGFEGPDVILEGKFGYLDVYARDGDPSLLVHELGSRWETRTTAFKAFPCHITAQAPLKTLLALKHEHAFGAADIASFTLYASEKVLSHHVIPAPRDAATAQYSVPYCLALALFRDPSDPQAFLEDPGRDQNILSMSQRIVVKPNDADYAKNDLACRIEITLRDGRTAKSEGTFNAASTAFATDQHRQKFFLLAGPDWNRGQQLYDRLANIETDRVGSLFRLS